MRRPVELHVVQLRKDMLFARRWAGVWVPATLMIVLGLWMLAVWCFLRGMLLPLALLPLLLSITLMIGMPFMLTNGAWLSIDRRRGWVHWQTCRWPRAHQESFSTHRLESLRIVRQGLRAPGLGIWLVELRLDHPRLPRVVLCSTLRLERAHALCRAASAALELGWHDEDDLLHVAMRARMDSRAVSWHGMEWIDQLPPTPEIGIEQLERGTRFILPADRRTGEGVSMLLLYGLVWCLWSWTSLMYELMRFGPAAQWTTPQQFAVLVLTACSLGGLGLLVRTLRQLLGQTRLEGTPRGWRMESRWAGFTWRRDLLRIEQNGWVRRVDPPGDEAGLWVTHGPRELQIGRGLSADSLAWLQQLIATRTARPEAAPAPAADVRGGLAERDLHFLTLEDTDPGFAPDADTDPGTQPRKPKTPSDAKVIDLRATGS